MKTTIKLLFFLSFLAFNVSAQNDEKFAQETAMGMLLEIKLGELAQTNAGSAEVKEAGKMMMDVHSTDRNELKNIAALKNIHISETLDKKHQKIYDKMMKLHGKEFDKKYIRYMIRDHEEDLCHFKHEAKKSDDVELKKFAASKLTVIQNHIDMWKRLCKSTK